MKRLNNKSGFTLIEIIVVLIIVGILAAIALPNLFSNVAKSKGAQALQSFDSYKSVLEAYYANKNTTPATADLTTNNLATSVSAGGTTWTMSILTAAQAQSATAGTGVAAAGTYNAGTLTYTLDANDGTNTIDLTRATNGTWSCSVGTNSPYTGIC